MSWKIKNIGVPSTDTNISNVSLLLHGDGTNGSTTIIDTSYSPKTITAFGDAKISTAQSKFGGASLAFDGAGDYISAPDTADLEFGSGSFTIEFWIYPVDNTARYIASKGNSNLPGTAWDISRPSSGVIRFFCYNGSSAIITALDSSSTAIINTWNHVAVVRNANSFNVYVNGSQGPTGTTSNSISDVSTGVEIGRLASVGNQFNGYIDDFRITKGIARYTSNFTPPTAPFPDF